MNSIYIREQWRFTGKQHSLYLALAYENLDADIVRCQETAEKKCRKVHTGKYYSSPILKLAYNTLDYWQKCKEYLQGNRKTISARELITIQKRLGIKYAPLTAAQVNEKIKEAEHKLKDIKKKGDLAWPMPLLKEEIFPQPHISE